MQKVVEKYPSVALQRLSGTCTDGKALPPVGICLGLNLLCRLVHDQDFVQFRAAERQAARQLVLVPLKHMTSDHTWQCASHW